MLPFNGQSPEYGRKGGNSSFLEKKMKKYLVVPWEEQTNLTLQTISL